MRLPLGATLLCAGLIVAAWPAAAQPTPPPPSQGSQPPDSGPDGPPDGPQDRPRGGQLFISPCGQPFRARSGEPYPVAAWFAQADANQDGAIDKAEFRADAQAFFQVLDLDHDGVVSGTEITNYEEHIVPEIGRGRMEADDGRIILVQMSGGMGGGMGHGGGGGHHGRHGQSGGQARQQGIRPEGAARYGLLGEPEPVAAADSNFDGRVTLTEFLAAADRRFDLLDTASDGRLTLAGLPQTPAQAGAAEHRKHRRKPQT